MVPGLYNGKRLKERTAQYYFSMKGSAAMFRIRDFNFSKVERSELHPVPAGCPGSYFTRFHHIPTFEFLIFTSKKQTNEPH
jgi:hypothetical protein